MARAIWSGVISFGLVSVPVKLYSATREHDVSFHQFEAGTADRIRYQRVNERTGKEVAFERIVRGAEVGAGKYVLVDQDELDSVAPGRSRSIEIRTFVDLAEIDPVYFQKTYYLGPGSAETAKTYALLRDAMAKANRAAIGTLVMRGKEYLAAIRADGDGLVLETMYFADEVRDPRKDVDRPPERVKPTPQELRTAGQLIDSMTGLWNPDDYRDTYTDRVNGLIQAKRRGKEVAVAEQAPEATNVTDLMEVLRRSVESAQQRRARPRKAAKRTPAKKAPAPAAARKTAARKATVTKAAPRKATKATGKAPARKAS